MPPPLPTAAIVVLSAMLAIVSALSGGLWWRLRSWKTSQPADPLVRELADRLQEVSAIVDRLEAVEERVRTMSRTPSPSAGIFPKGPSPGWRADPASPDMPPGPTLISVPDLASPVSEAIENVADELTERYRPIWDLADSGSPPDAIARATGQPIGQVELILGLRRQLPPGGVGPRS